MTIDRPKEEDAPPPPPPLANVEKEGSAAAQAEEKADREADLHAQAQPSPGESAAAIEAVRGERWEREVERLHNSEDPPENRQPPAGDRSEPFRTHEQDLIIEENSNEAAYLLATETVKQVPGLENWEPPTYEQAKAAAAQTVTKAEEAQVFRNAEEVFRMSTPEEQSASAEDMNTRNPYE